MRAYGLFVAYWINDLSKIETTTTKKKVYFKGKIFPFLAFFLAYKDKVDFRNGWVSASL